MKVKEAGLYVLGLIVLLGLYGGAVYLNCKVTGLSTIVIGRNTVVCPK